MNADDRVLLIDVENVVGGSPPRPEALRARVGALLAAAGEIHHALACYAVPDRTTDAALAGWWALVELGVPALLVEPGPDAAENALLAHARYVLGRGGRSFVVASGDRRFAELAQQGRLEVLVRENQPVAGALELTADELRRIPLPGPPGPPGPPGADVPTSAAPTPGRGPGQAAGHRPVRVRSRLPGSPVLSGLTGMAAGPATGLGIGLGSGWGTGSPMSLPRVSPAGCDAAPGDPRPRGPGERG